MKKKKMNLDTLKVESFVTTMEEGMENTAKGGTIINTIAGPGCTVIINTRICPSLVDGCLSALGCTILPTTGTISDTINPGPF